VRQTNRVLAVRGQVVPAAPLPLTLHAELADGRQVDGQSAISQSTGIRRVWISPADVHATADAMQAIAAADVIILGPGSLYTSLLPSLLIPEIRTTLAAATGTRVYVVNVATQIGETEGYALSDHLAALDRHGLRESVVVVLANDRFEARAPERWPAVPVRLDLPPSAARRPRLVLADVIDIDNAHHHDPAKLAGAILGLEEVTGASVGTGVARSA
jgi:uncharacterized cofD-like protein